jgi:beta-glucosidase
VTRTLPYQDRALSPEQRTRDLLARMSLEEKVGQLMQADGRVNAAEQVRERSAGSFLHILGEPTVELQRLAEQTGLGVPLIFGIDAIHGHGFWRGATVFPTQLAISCSWNPDLLETQGRITAREMLATGLHWTFSPVLCLARDLRWGRINETFGEDQHLLGVLGSALVRGLQGQHLSDPDSVIACAKHFAGYCETVGGRDGSEAEISERKLRSTFLPPFQEMVKAGCRSFMTAYQNIDGVACTINRWLLTDVLRGEWGFEGFVVTDWNNVGRLVEQRFLYDSVEAAAPDALRAGNDMIMTTPGYYRAVIAQVQAGKVSVEDVDLACSRILRHKFELGLFDDKRYPPLERAAEIVGCAEHRAPLLRAALESIVLLKNDPAPATAADGAATPLLPLGPGIRRIAVLGPNADDTLSQLGDWSFGSGQAMVSIGGHPRHLVSTVLDGVKEQAAKRGIAVDYHPGCEVMDADLSDIAAAQALAAAADLAVVVVGDVLEQTGELKDRYELDLTGGQLPLLEAVRATGTPFVVVLINSKPLCIPWVAEHATAILEAFNPGMEGGRAVAQLLFGEASPCGKLTISFPSHVGQQPVHYQEIPGWHGNKNTGYTSEPLYAFGYGLSYTRYAYSNLELSSERIQPSQNVRVSVDVKNEGERAGTEIVQLYLNDVVTSCSTPNKILKRYARVTLAPGETRRVQFELGRSDLTFLGRDCKPRTEPGEFRVMVGASSRERDLLSASFWLTE